MHDIEIMQVCGGDKGGYRTIDTNTAFLCTTCICYTVLDIDPRCPVTVSCCTPHTLLCVLRIINITLECTLLSPFSTAITVIQTSLGQPHRIVENVDWSILCLRLVTVDTSLAVWGITNWGQTGLSWLSCASFGSSPENNVMIPMGHCFCCH